MPSYAPTYPDAQDDPVVSKVFVDHITFNTLLTDNLTKGTFCCREYGWHDASRAHFVRVIRSRHGLTSFASWVMSS